MTSEVTQTTLVLLYDGQRHPVGADGLTLGRSADNDLALDSEKASRRHARVVSDADGLAIEDLGSTHGTSLNGEPFTGESRRLSPGDRIEIGEATIRVLAGGETRFEPAAVGEVALREESATFSGERLSIGRQEGNDLVLPDPNVSRMHAELVRGADGSAELIDLGSKAGTRVNGVPQDRARLEPGSTVGIGPYEVHFDGNRLVAHDRRSELRMSARNVSMTVGDKQILKPVSVTVEPGELVVLIGASGAGKSTLLKLLAGVNQPSSGTVTVNDEPLAARLTDVGYVPQDEIVHPELTVREALRYAARLRLPQDTSPAEVADSVDRVLAELSLTPHADTRIGSLSGGQRKRAGVAAELLGRPSLLFLDEPTTGLDPSLEGRLMALLRELADGGRGVVVVTHATASLGLADRVIVMGAGGFRAFEGAPAEAVAFFEVDAFEGIYEKLDETPPEEVRDRFEATRDGAPVEADPEEAPQAVAPQRGASLLRQAATLTARQGRVFLRDRRNLALAIGQVPILALLDALIFPGGIFETPGSPGDAIQFLFLIVLAPLWFGATLGAREIVKEDALRRREAALGVRVGAYLLSKCAVLFAVAGTQALLFAVIVLGLQPLHESADAYVGVVVLLLLTSFAAVALGLVVSSLVTSEDQAMTIIPLIIIPQLLFAGAVVPLERMAQPFAALAEVHISKWSLAGAGTQVDLNERMAASPEFAQVNRYGDEFFDISLATSGGALLAFMLVFLGITAAVLHRKRQS